MVASERTLNRNRFVSNFHCSKWNRCLQTFYLVKIKCQDIFKSNRFNSLINELLSRYDKYEVAVMHLCWIIVITLAKWDGKFQHKVLLSIFFIVNTGIQNTKVQMFLAILITISLAYIQGYLYSVKFNSSRQQISNMLL